ncbi:MAG: single-stranded DNA-binding protein [Candidatus Cloacimonas sp.]|nr:single-stranded DNA-binding protein [Candidatus Cloacimonadota bacterium]
MARDIRLPKLNSVIISGHLTRDVELRYTPKGTAVAKFSVAFNRNYQGSDGNWVEEAHFLDIVAWARTAEISAERLSKGSPVVVEGYLSAQTFTDKEGAQRKRVEIVANKIHYIEKTDYTGGDYEAPPIDEGGDSKFTDDDVPF